jgi:molybdopterin-containing oxidoreductase family iron-sulfur binding subunit
MSVDTSAGTSTEARDELALERVRARLSAARGAEFWRELERLAAEPELAALLAREFPSLFARTGPGLERRELLRLMGASLGVMGLAACTRQPDETIVPFARAPELVVPGRPLYFATAFALGGAATGLLVESHMGRPTKVEGNPDHPSSLGATDALAQAALLGLYDPDRSHSCLRAGQIGTWSAFTSELAGRLEGIAAHRGEGLAVLVGGESSPLLAAQLARLAARFPKARTFRWTPLHRDHARAGAELVYGRDVGLRHDYSKARVVLALEADFLARGPERVRAARDFAAGRMGRSWASEMSRLYALESTLSTTGAMADERLAVRPSELEGLARWVAKELGLALEAPALEARAERFARAVAADLRAHAGASLVVAGEGADPNVHALAHLLNHRLRSPGATLELTLPLESASEPAAASIRQLVEDVRARRVDTLVMLGGNPVYDAPAELDFGAALRTVPFRVHHSEQVDETSALCHWHLPATHFLESWSDARAHDGTVSLVQPLIAPLYADGGAKSVHELVALVAGESGKSGYQLLREHWQAASGLTDAAEFERFWRAALHDGVVPGTAFPALSLDPRAELELGPPPASARGLELVLVPDASTFDGRFANNAWLQELPRPLTRLVWDNALLVSAATARELGLESGDVVRLAADGRSLEAPAWIAPGQADGVVTLALGYGRRTAGTLGSGVGCDAYALRTSAAPWRHSGVSVTPSGARHALATVQKHPEQEGRNLARVATFERFKAAGARAFEGAHVSPFDELRPPSLYPGFPPEGNAWGLVIDLNACIGCNACMVACQAENNVPVVGKDEVANGREMHWIRIDRYYEPASDGGANDSVQVLHQPVPCMHCENAPCETVCPVGATVHGAEGLNEMVYNRCIGTRYCSNNCPYKVRRFNFRSYVDQAPTLALGRNPDVTVRSRGVMEKCTYCVQRISQARIAAKKEERPIRDGEIVTACQAVCPTRALTFGDVADPTSAISKLRAEPHHYGLLAELGTRPRTTYLGRLRNPNPALARPS